MIDSHGSLRTSTSLKCNIFHRQVCSWTLSNSAPRGTVSVPFFRSGGFSWKSTNIDDFLWPTMKGNAFYHEIPWMSMYIHRFSLPVSTGHFHISGRSVQFHLFIIRYWWHNASAIRYLFSLLRRNSIGDSLSGLLLFLLIIFQCKHNYHVISLLPHHYMH